jgi:hypothetical protein
VRVVVERAELAFVPDQGAVEQLVAQRPDPTFGERVRIGARGGVLIPVIPAASNTVSNPDEYWPAPSWIT